MRTINKLRTSILIQMIEQQKKEQEEGGDCSFTVNSWVPILMSDAVCCEERMNCPSCKTTKTKDVCYLSTHTTLKSDLSNFAASISQNYPSLRECSDCNSDIDVLRHMSNHALIQLTSSRHVLGDIPQFVTIENTNFQIAGGIVFEAPLIDGQIGHYRCFFRSHNRWVIYDDLKDKPFTCGEDAEMQIEFLLYVKIQ